MKKRLLLTLTVAVCMLCCMLGMTACGTHKHTLTLVSEKAATCKSDGAKSAYYACSECDKLFSDENGKNEIKDKSTVVLPRLQHDFQDGLCTLCGGKEPTEGLLYSVMTSGRIQVSKGDLSVDHPVHDIVIADFYEGKPVEFIADNAFRNCTFISTVEIPDGVMFISSYAFKGCSNMTSITIPDSVVSISNGAFEECAKLESIHIPYGIETIQNAFKYTHFTYVELPESVTKVVSDTGLANAVIPVSVTSIGERGFTGTNYYKGTAEDWAKIDVNTNNSTWVRDVHFYSETQPVTEGKYWHYDTDGKTPVAW